MAAGQSVDEEDVAARAQRAHWRTVRGWLLLAAGDPTRAAKEWEKLGATLLACGTEWAVVKIQPEVVWAVAGTKKAADVNAYLAEALGGGPVFVRVYPDCYYALVPVEASQRREWQSEAARDDATFLGTGSYVGVPEPTRVDAGNARFYWAVPVAEAGRLCSPEAVSQMIARGRYNLALRDEGERE